MLAPLDKGYITQVYKGSSHYGIDIGWLRLGLRNPPIRAWDDGIVIASYFMTGGGNTVVIRHEGSQWYQTRYVHLHSRMVTVGQIVKRGQVIGLGGNTGTLTTGDHLHFEVLIIPNGYRAFSYGDRVRYAVDPLKVTFFTEVTGQGVLSMTEVFDRLPLAIPKYNNVRMRSTPAIIPQNIIQEDGVTVFVPMEGLRFVSSTKEVIDGHQWAKLIYKGQEVYVSMSLLDVKENIVTKIVEKIVEIEKPFKAVLVQDGLTINIVREVLK